MEAGHDEQGMGTRDLVGGGAAPDSEIDGNRDRGETPVDIVDEERAREEDDGTLLPPDEDARFQHRWEELQAAFVDEPRRTVEQADELVAQVMKRIAEGFATEREQLEQHWGRGEDVSTEDLRVALQRYRAFFRRLLSA